MRVATGALLLVATIGCADAETRSVLVEPCPAGGVTLVPSVATLVVGDSVRARVLPGAAGCTTFALRDGDRFIWRSSDTTVARVDSLGLVAAVRAGQVTIRATAVRDFSVSGASQVVVR